MTALLLCFSMWFGPGDVVCPPDQTCKLETLAIHDNPIILAEPCRTGEVLRFDTGQFFTCVKAATWFTCNISINVEYSHNRRIDVCYRATVPVPKELK